jgi:hypothetical protein
LSRRGQDPWAGVRRAARRERRWALVGVAAAVTALVPLSLLIGWLVGDRWGDYVAGPILLLVGTVAVAAIAVAVLFRRWVRPITEGAVAAAVERGHGLAAGSLRGVMELARGLPSGSSAGLFRRAESDLAVRLAPVPVRQLAGDLGRVGRGRRARVATVAVVLTLLAAVAAFAAPDRARVGWAPLLHPVEHLRGPVLPPLSVSPGHASVERGLQVELGIDAPLRSRVTLVWRSAGDVSRQVDLPVTEDRALGRLGPVDAPMDYQIRSPDGAASPWYRLTPVDPLLLRGLSYELEFPGYLGMGPERLNGETAGVLTVPDGSTLRVRGSATRTLAAAWFARADGVERTASTRGGDFELEWRLGAASSGLWSLELRTGDGAAGRPASLELRVTRDLPPRVQILVPGADTVLPLDRRQPIVAAAVDDHGLASAELVYRRVGPRGDAGAQVRRPLELDRGAQVARVEALLDLSDEALVPGDLVEYHVAVRDASPAGQEGRSETFLLRLPSAADLRDRALADAAELERSAVRATERARALDRALRDLDRRVSTRSPARGPGGGGDPGRSNLDFQLAREAVQLEGRQAEGARELADLRHRLEQLRAAAAAAGLREPDLDRRLRSLAELYRDLEQSGTEATSGPPDDGARPLESLDVRSLAAQLDRMRERQEQWTRQLEESLARLREAALEQEMAALAREADDIAARQEALTAAYRSEPEPADQDPGAEVGSEGAGPAEEQRDLAARTQRLTDLIQSLQQQLLQRGDQQTATQAGSAQEQGRSAQESMQVAAERARAQDRDGAAAAGEDAAGRLSEAARSLDEARGQRSRSGQEAAVAAARDGAQEALRLAEREDALRREMEGAQASGSGVPTSEVQRLQSEQMAVRQGLQQLGENLAEASREAGMNGAAVSQAVARAMLDLDRAVGGLQEGRSLPVREAERAVESLNRLAMALIESDDDAGRGRASGAEEVLRQVAEVAREQQGLNARVGAMAPMDGGRNPAQMAQLAEQQRGIARRVGEVSGALGGREDVLGRLDELSSEAAAIAIELEGGRLEPEVRARQERLYHRLLDAGRTLEREEYGDERAGEAAEARPAPVVAPLDPAILDARARYAGPSAEQLRRLPPAYRRLVLEYFDRLNAGSSPTMSPGGGRP